jgi:hypothetical protein
VTRQRKMLGFIAVSLVVGLIALMTSAAGGQTSVRGFDGKTIKIAGLGLGAGQFMPDAGVGTQARIDRFNNTNEIKGLKIESLPFADDKADPALSLSEARRLVDQEGVFGIVPALSVTLPASYLTSKHVPLFGSGIDPMFCTPTPSKTVWAFGWAGCQTPPDTTKRVANTAAGVYKYASTETGNKKPTVVIFSSDLASGIVSARNAAASYSGSGFDVLYAKGEVPLQTSDYTPYVQRYITGDDGKAPDVITCLAATTCIQMYSAIRAAGYTGIYVTSLYSAQLIKPLSGALVSWAAQAFNATGVPALEQMKKDVEAVKPGAQLSSAMSFAYFGSDFFIQTLKKVVKADGVKGITPEKVQKAASTITWELKDLAGPQTYPAATVNSSPGCGTILISDGTQYNIAEKYSCSNTTYPVNPKFSGK